MFQGFRVSGFRVLGCWLSGFGFWVLGWGFWAGVLVTMR